MANWKEIGNGAKRAANKAIQKTGEIADVASMHLRLKSLESKRDEQYELLGKLTYRQLKTGESQATRIAATIEKLDELRAKIRELGTQIEEEKAARKQAREQKKKESVSFQIEVEKTEDEEKSGE